MTGYRTIADTTTHPDLTSTHAEPGDRLVHDVIDDDRWTLVRIERPAPTTDEPAPQPPTREQIAELLFNARYGEFETWEAWGAFARQPYFDMADAMLALIQNGAGR